MPEVIMWQRVMGKLSWDEYVRLRRHSKDIRENQEDIIRRAIVAYLDRIESGNGS